MSLTNTSQAISPFPPVALAVPVNPWIKLISATAVDNATPIADPFSATYSAAATTTFAYNAVDARQGTGGRLLVAGRSTGRVEILPLHITSTAVDIQLFAFDVQSLDTIRGDGGSPNPVSQNPNTKADKIILGVPYSLTRDLTSAPSKVTLTAPATNACTLSLKFTPNGIPYEAASGGTTYTVGERLVFDAPGFGAFLPVINTITGGGTVVLLGRVL